MNVPPQWLLAGVLLLLPTLDGCKFLRRPVDPQEPNGAEAIVELEEGEREALDELDATLEFVRKVSESRCPHGAECVWAGEARILVMFDPAETPAATFELPIGGFLGADADNGHAAVDTLGYRFTLLELTPYPEAEMPQPDEAAQALIRIVRLDG